MPENAKGMDMHYWVHKPHDWFIVTSFLDSQVLVRYVEGYYCINLAMSQKMLATYERVFVTNNIPDGGPIIWTGLVWVLCTCMAIGSKVECSFAALAGDLSLLAHPCSRTILLQLHGEFDGGADVKSLPVLFATSTIGGGGGGTLTQRLAPPPPPPPPPPHVLPTFGQNLLLVHMRPLRMAFRRRSNRARKFLHLGRETTKYRITNQPLPREYDREYDPVYVTEHVTWQLRT